jgi:hypothetical protein
MRDHASAPLRVTPPLLREGERTLWPGKAGSTGVLGQCISRRVGSVFSSGYPVPARRSVSLAQGTAELASPGRQCRPLGGVTPQAAQGGANHG